MSLEERIRAALPRWAKPLWDCVFRHVFYLVVGTGIHAVYALATLIGFCIAVSIISVIVQATRGVFGLPGAAVVIIGLLLLLGGGSAGRGSGTGHTRSRGEKYSKWYIWNK